MVLSTPPLLVARSPLACLSACLLFLLVVTRVPFLFLLPRLFFYLVFLPPRMIRPSLAVSLFHCFCYRYCTLPYPPCTTHRVLCTIPKPTSIPTRIMIPTPVSIPIPIHMPFFVRRSPRRRPLVPSLHFLRSILLAPFSSHSLGTDCSPRRGLRFLSWCPVHLHRLTSEYGANGLAHHSHVLTRGPPASCLRPTHQRPPCARPSRSAVGPRPPPVSRRRKSQVTSHTSQAARRRACVRCALWSRSGQPASQPPAMEVSFVHVVVQHHPRSLGLSRALVAFGLVRRLWLGCFSLCFSSPSRSWLFCCILLTPPPSLSFSWPFFSSVSQFPAVPYPYHIARLVLSCLLVSSCLGLGPYHVPGQPVSPCLITILAPLGLSLGLVSAQSCTSII